MTLWDWLMSRLTPDEAEEWSSSFPQAPEDMECPDTQPTSPGALDSDMGRLE